MPAKPGTGGASGGGGGARNSGGGAIREVLGEMRASLLAAASSCIAGSALMATRAAVGKRRQLEESLPSVRQHDKRSGTAFESQLMGQLAQAQAELTSLPRLLHAWVHDALEEEPLVDVEARTQMLALVHELSAVLGE